MLADTSSVGSGPVRALGPAMVLARRVRDDAPLHVLADEAAGVLARRAGEFAAPPTVWQIDGTSLQRAEPQPIPPAEPLDPRVAPFADLLARCGADPLVEHGRLIGEVAGLEVARIVVGEDGPRLEVGVGRFDREGHEMVANGAPDEVTLRRVVALVRSHRIDAGEHHPLRTLAAARGVRARLVADPSLVGADHLLPLPPVVEPPDLKTPWPAAAAGADLDGAPLVVVCSVGIDLDFVPTAAEARLAAFGDSPARLVLAVPERDIHTITLDLAGALRVPAEVRGIG